VRVVGKRCSRSAKRHRQRHKDRRYQQRDALAHRGFLSSTLPLRAHIFSVVFRYRYSPIEAPPFSPSLQQKRKDASKGRISTQLEKGRGGTPTGGRPDGGWSRPLPLTILTSDDESAMNFWRISENSLQAKFGEFHTSTHFVNKGKKRGRAGAFLVGTPAEKSISVNYRPPHGGGLRPTSRAYPSLPDAGLSALLYPGTAMGLKLIPD
jgi:hypothetical protein